MPASPRLHRPSLPLCLLLGGLLVATHARADAAESAVIASFLTQPTAGLGDMMAPVPWGCGGAAPVTQTILQLHWNWHCSFDNTINPALGRFPNDGNRFFGFHRQFLYTFNTYRQSQGLPFLQTWMPFAGATMPLGHAARPDLTPCNNCTTLPNAFRLPSAGGTFNPATTTLEDYGNSLVPWHNGTHVAMAQAGGNPGEDCFLPTSPLHFRDIMCVTTAPRDPMFFRFHNFVNDLQDELLTFQDTDVMVVFDRSGSMTLPNGTGTDTRLNSARAAASLFADLMRDASNNRVGLLSFSTAASPSPELPLTLASSAPAAMTTALAGISAGGATSIGGGLLGAVTALNASSNPHKAILLLTDGVENTAPMIADAVGRTPNQLRDTHVCAVGFGTPGSLDGPKLRDLAERQGGTYRADADPLTLKKYFVECFADIFDTFVGKDPIGTLAAGQQGSAPTVHVASGDGEVVFVSSWDTAVPPGSLRLSVTSPSGTPVNLNAPNVESRFGPTWHIVRIKTPYLLERDGRWTARLTRPMRSFVNGFTPDTFKTPAVGTALYAQQLAQLCADGCGRTLFYEEAKASLIHHSHGNALYPAVINTKKAGVTPAVDRVATPEAFAAALKRGGYDLVVTSLLPDSGPQAYDDLLAEWACSGKGPKILLNDVRKEGGEATLRCLGATRTDERGFSAMKGDGSVFSGSVGFAAMPMAGMTMRPDTVSFKPTGAAGTGTPGVSPQRGAVIVSRAAVSPNAPATAQRYFIESLASGTARVRPHTWRSPNYTGEDLHPAFHIPEPYIPLGGFDRVTARVEVTRPLESQGRLYAGTDVKEGTRREGDPLTLRQTADLRVNPRQAAGAVKTETLSFPLNDLGQDGDTSASDRYWEVALPEKVAEFDGEYTFHAYFTICRGTLCFDREAQQTVVVDAKPDPRASKVQLVQTPNTVAGVANVLCTPLDAAGLPLGPDRQSQLRFTGSKGVEVKDVRSVDAAGTYAITATYDPLNTNPTLTVAPFGRPTEALEIALR
ncbi:vWA domain-containing protein [Deinococcus yunweiensis]|uniref:vWA domain-containing protein n=1 Tax=Deinococcus yunweiensis TaxID=367282 RepID=UPI00398E9E61